MPNPIRLTSDEVDWTQRYQISTAIVASPAAAAETIIAQITVNLDLQIKVGVDLTGWAAYTVGTSGTAVQFRLRQTNVAGTIVGNTGALTGSQHGAGILSADDCEGFDNAPPAGGVYVLTMQVTAGAAQSTVSAVKLRAFVI
jgi:hypothetical protein